MALTLGLHLVKVGFFPEGGPGVLPFQEWQLSLAATPPPVDTVTSQF